MFSRYEPPYTEDKITEFDRNIKYTHDELNSLESNATRKMSAFTYNTFITDSDIGQGGFRKVVDSHDFALYNLLLAGEPFGSAGRGKLIVERSWSRMLMVSS